MGWAFKHGWRRYSLLVLLPVLLGMTQPKEVQHAKEEATAQLVQILELWHVEKYGAIYDLGTITTKRIFSRQEFTSRMLGQGCRTTCCHTTFTLHRADYRSPELVVVTGKVGFELTGRAAPRFDCSPIVRSFPMAREADGWRIDLTRMLLFF